MLKIFWFISQWKGHFKKMLLRAHTKTQQSVKNLPSMQICPSNLQLFNASENLNFQPTQKAIPKDLGGNQLMLTSRQSIQRTALEVLQTRRSLRSKTVGTAISARSSSKLPNRCKYTKQTKFQSWLSRDLADIPRSLCPSNSQQKLSILDLSFYVINLSYS